VSDVDAARLLFGRHRFEVALVGMATSGGVEVCKVLAAETRVVAFAVSGDDDEVVACAEAGVSGYLLREQTYDELVDVIARVARGEIACPARVAAALMRRVGTLAADRVGAREDGPGPVGATPRTLTAGHLPSGARLTPREREVLDSSTKGAIQGGGRAAGRLCLAASRMPDRVGLFGSIR
jgi:DNA-binding NarL/FixJ family response regulator